MSLRRGHVEINAENIWDMQDGIEESQEHLSRRRDVRKRLERRLEKQRLKAELEDELDRGFQWDED
ncbi:MAG: hypothetical protein Q8R79_01430 [Legionellaceae bacterium]|nr:hypothetical protein [Legionellaceae bacterium]